MADLNRSLTAFLALAAGLALPVSVPAEEHKPAAAHPPAAAAPVAAAKTAAAQEGAKPAPPTKAAVPPVAPTVAPPPRPRARPAARVALAARSPVEPPPPAPAPVPAHAPHWSYEGDTGPHAWAKLSPEFAKCANGERQSPIDIRDGLKVDLEPVAFDYRPSRFKVVDTGHSIQANVGGWNSMQVMGRRFRLVQFHFHTPSEEAVNGRQFEMVVHMVHKDAQDRLAVVAVLVEAGSRQAAVQTVLNNLPLEKGMEVAAASDMDPLQLLPADRRYYAYMGSLTTPPCTEDVLWIVMKQPVQAATDQLNLFSRLYPMNARPIQAAGGRTIKESN